MYLRVQSSFFTNHPRGVVICRVTVVHAMALVKTFRWRWGSLGGILTSVGRAVGVRTLSNPTAAGSDEGGVRVEPSEEELAGAEPWMVDELTRYYQGRRRLADMMGVPPQEFTDEDVEEALRYLLPSRLFARDARPSMKHPFKIFPERKEALFDSRGRPLDPGFYTGSPAYHTLVYQIFQHGAGLSGSPRSEEGVELQSPDTDEEVGKKEVPKVWIKKEAMENVIAEQLSNEQYNDLIGRLSALASHPNSSAISEFLDVYRRSVFSYRSSTHTPTPSPDGSVRAVGKRKTATAVVTLRQGSGVILVNKKDFVEYFPRVVDRQQVMYPLIVTDLVGKYDVTAIVRGGGITGVFDLSPRVSFSNGIHVAVQVSRELFDWVSVRLCWDSLVTMVMYWSLRGYW